LLARPELEQLRQRVTVSYHLQPLGADETAAYINHRLRRAAIGAPLEFSRDVTDLIHQSSEGIPRKINVIADAILLFGYGEERRSIDVELTREVVEELKAVGVIGTRAAAAPASAPAGVLAAAPPTSAVVAPVTPAVTESTAELAAREARLAEREKQLAEQKQVLLESYQLLRAARGKAAVDAAPPVAAAASAIAPAHPAWPPSRPAPAEPMPSMVGNPPPRTSPIPARPIPALSSSHRLFREPEAAPEGLLTRLYRGLFGLGKPVFEEWKL